MKLFFIILLLISVVSGASGEGSRFILQGTIAGVPAGRLLVVTSTCNGTDTLASGEVLGGKFSLEGHLRAPVVAALVLEGSAGGFVFFPEPDAEYTADLKPGTGSVISGGVIQQEWTAYQRELGQADQELGELQGRWEEATRLRRFKTAAELKTELENRQQLATGKLDEIVRRNQDNVLGAYIRLGHLTSEDPDQMKQVYESLTVKARETEPARMLAARIAKTEQLQPGKTAPDFTLLAPDGQPLSLYSLKGKLKIIDFWASWCGPCRLENPNMVELYREFKDRGLVILSVSLDEKREKWTQAVEKDGMAWPQVSSLKGWACEVARLYQVTAVPSVFILDEDNRIVATQLRGEKLHHFVTERLH